MAETEKSPTLAHPSWRNPWVVLAFVVIAGVLLIGAARHLAENRDLAMQKFARVGAGYGAGPMMRHGLRTFVGGPQVDGVVTAVNGNKLTVAGGGTTTEVDTSGSTQYTNAGAVAVNDTVVATGTFSGNVLTATHITVNPQ
jgi:hypothetical protein